MEGYFSQKWLFSAAAYGVTDNLTLLAGTLTVFPPALTIAGGKISGEIADNVHLSAGGEVFVTGLGVFEFLARVGFAGITVGHDDRQFTLSSGYMLLGDDYTVSAVPIIAAGQFRVTDRTVLITENWFVMPREDDPFGFVSGAVRLLGGRADTRRTKPTNWTSAGDPKYTSDFGVIFMSDGSDVYGPLPWIDFAWHFGKAGR